MQITFELDNLEATEALAKRLASIISPPFIIGLKGEIGMGKTSFARAFIQSKGIHSKIKSPSFTLLETYQAFGTALIHMDLYRLESLYELEELGFRDVLNDKSICLIEWPERSPMLQALMDLVLEFSLNTQSEGRTLIISAVSAKAKLLIEALKREPCLKK